MTVKSKSADGGAVHAAPATRPLAHSREHSIAGAKPASVRLLDVFTGMAADLHRIADALDPPPPDLVGTPYVAAKVGVSTTQIANLARDGVIPQSCVVAGTGNGKPWKFHRDRIEQWLASR